MAGPEKETTDVLMQEEELYESPKSVVEKANVKDWNAVLKKGEKDLKKFWEEAAEELSWYKKWDKVLDDSKKPFYKWFVGGKCNIVQNAIDRHIENGNGDRLAIIWEGENGDSRKLTYSELNREVTAFACVLKSLGVERKHRIAIYLPNIPEIAISMLACAKVGAIHSVVYAGFSAKALQDRINDEGAEVLVTADGTYRNGKTINLKSVVDEALERCPTVRNVVVVKRTGDDVDMNDGHLWYHELMEEASQKICYYRSSNKFEIRSNGTKIGKGYYRTIGEAKKKAKELVERGEHSEVTIHEIRGSFGKEEVKTEPMDAGDMLYILYTSGTTGKPKGVVQVHGGYMVGIHRTLKWVFDIKPGDVYWCAADPGWVTGHSYIVYGPLIAGTTTVMYEGHPLYPEPDRMWDIIERYGITILYTAPTTIRMLMKYGEEWPKKHDLGSLRLLGSVGEPINPEAWRWYHKHIGQGKCPIMDTWWQTETGMFMITPLPVASLKPGSATKPFPGIQADVVDASGKPVPPGKGGFLVIKTPWPAMLRTLYKDPDRYLETYWEKVPGGYYLAGDMARKDKDGYFWIQGRADDVLNISGHRIGTAEIESALVSHESVAEAAVIGVPDELRGEVAKAFVILKGGVAGSEALVKELKLHIRKVLSPIAVTDKIEFVDSLPKTRSGKIMRRVLKARELGIPEGDLSTLAD